ncbi:MAG: hypothetical protein IH899_06305 [Planctomycetes bacterium]|nr:hypothetical protein [Planctomycetota bacterium]
MFLTWRLQFVTIEERQTILRTQAIAIAGEHLAQLIKADQQEKQNNKDINPVAVLYDLPLEESEQKVATYHRKRGSKKHLKSLIAVYLNGNC